MKQDKTLSLLGMAKRAGKVQSGGFLAEKSIQSRRAALVIIAEDVSGNTRKRFTDKCSSYGVPFKIYADMDLLGASIGCGPRSVVCVEDAGFAKALVKKMELPDPGE